MSSPSPSEVTPPSRTRTRTRRTSNTCPQCPHHLSNYASENMELPPPPTTHPPHNTVPLMTEPQSPSLPEFPIPIFTSLLDTDIDIFPNPTREPANEDRTSLKGLLEATKRALAHLDENSVPALNENDEEDHADREWAELCALRGLEVELEEMIRAESSNGDVDTVSEHDKLLDTETRERRPSRKGILRSRSNSSESDFPIAKKTKSVTFDEEAKDGEPVIIRKKNGVRFDEKLILNEKTVVKKKKKKKSVRFEEPVNLVGAEEGMKKNVGFDGEHTRSDKLVPKMKKRVSFELETEENGEQIVKKKTVRLLDSEDEDGSGTQSRISLHGDKSQTPSEQDMVEKTEDHALM